MKKIKTIKIWNNGQLINATQFQLNAINVNLENSATFYYSLLTEDNIKLTEGNLNMEGTDYQNWQSDEYAWNWAAEKLKIELISE
jgi:hypothetical protein